MSSFGVIDGLNTHGVGSCWHSVKADALTPFVCRIVLTHERTSFISRLSTILNRKLSVMAVTV